MPKLAPAATQTPGKYNVYFPQRKQQYLAFNSLTEAQAAVKASKAGVILNPAGQLDPAVQAWSQWSDYQSKFPAVQVVLKPGPMPGAAPSGKSNGAGPIHVTSSSSTPVGPKPASFEPTRPAHQVSVWFPAPIVSTLGLSYPASFAGGAYLAFRSTQDAEAHVQAKGVGVVLDAQGKLGPTQPWGNAPQYGAQLLNAELKTERIANKVNVWFPPNFTNSLGLADRELFTGRGAYLAFPSVKEATAHVQARGIGVILDKQGDFDLTISQPWAQAAPYGMQVSNSKLTATQTPHQHAVWMSDLHVPILAETTPGYTKGGYLAFNSEKEARTYVQMRGSGVMLEPSGEPSAVQAWDGAGPDIATLSNGKLTTSLTAGQFNVWFPAHETRGLRLGEGVKAFEGGAYLAFDTLAAAQAHVKQRTFGVVLDGRGAFDAKVQPWSQAGSYGSQQLNTQVKAQPTANSFNVWFPAVKVGSLGLADPSAFKRGAFMAFKSAAEASAHVKERGFGVVLNKQGAFDTSVAQSVDVNTEEVQVLINAKLSATRPKSASVWFPPDQLQWLGKMPSGSKFPEGAYLPFDNAPAALAYVKAVGDGAALDASGELEPQTGSNLSSQTRAMQKNDQLKPEPTPGKINVWFPTDWVNALGVSDAELFSKEGAYLAFDSIKAATAHVEARGLGVLFDAKGGFERATQAWPKAGRYALQLLNPKLVTTTPPNQPYVWFPADYVSRLGLTEETARTFASGGAFLPFSTVQEAKEHVATRDLGVVFGPRSTYDPANQSWKMADLYAPTVAVWPPPPVKPEGLTQPMPGSADILGVYAKSTPGGAHFAVRTHNTKLNETLKYELFLTINGSDMKVKDLGTSTMGDGYVHDALFDVKYADLNPILSALQGSNVLPGATQLSVKVTWPNGHDQGASGGGGRGAHRFLAP